MWAVMTIDHVAIHSSISTVLSEAAIGAWHGQARPAPNAVVEALLQAEKAAKQQRISYPFTSLRGEWRLCFTTGTRKVQRGGIRLGKGFYVPRIVPAQISFTPSDDRPHAGEIGNQVQVAGLRLRLTGPCRYVDKKNLLAFDFTRMELRLFDRPIYSGNIRGGQTKAAQFDEQPIAKLPFFAFFWITETAIAARGRGGGLAIWVRESPAPIQDATL